MGNRKSIILVLALLALFAILGVTLFKLKEVPDINWRKNFHFDSKQAHGTWLFRNLLQERYGAENVNLMNNSYNSLAQDSALYIYIGNSFYYPERRLDSLRSFASNGNDVLFITSSPQLLYQDTFKNISDYTFNLHDSIVHYSTACVGIEEPIQEQMNFSTAHHDPSLDSLRERDFQLVNRLRLDEDLVDYEPILCASDTSLVWLKMDDSGFHFYLIPESLSNIASESEGYLEHFNFLMDQFEVTHILLDHPSFYGSYNDEDRHSPIEYILRTPPLAWAYYLTLGSLLLFVIFGGKRKQRAIPLIEKNENTSLEYINVLSEIFQKQEQHHKLVKHMKDNFEHQIRRRYYLDVQQEGFLEQLSRKSKVKLDRLNMMYRIFNKAANDRSISDIQLNQLYSHIDYFHKNAQ